MLYSLFNFVTTLEYITLLAAVIFLHAKKVGKWRLFIVLLFLIVCAEDLGWYWHHILGKENAWIFNINMIITMLFLLWIMSTNPAIQKSKKLIYLFIGIFFVWAFMNIYFFQGIG